MRLVAEQHPIGGGEGERVGGALLPCQVPGARHQLAVLHAAELGERAVGRLIAPDALRSREHRVAAVAFLVVAVVLIAMDDDFVADLPALDLGADRPHDPGRVGPGDVVGRLVRVERRNRLAERGPDAVVIDPRRHHQHQHIVAVERPGRQDLNLHRAFGRSVPFLTDRPGVHGLRHMAERRNLADLVEILDWSRNRRVAGDRSRIHEAVLDARKAVKARHEQPNIAPHSRKIALSERKINPRFLRPLPAVSRKSHNRAKGVADE